MQTDNKGHNRLIECGSSVISDVAKRTYSISELELGAIEMALRKMRMMTIGNPNIIIKTDHLPLISMMQKPIDKLETSRLTKMMEKIAPFQFKIFHTSKLETY